MQFTLDCNSSARPEQEPVKPPAAWLDVTEVARGVSFTATRDIRYARHDTLAPLRVKFGGDDDQRLYGCLWLAHIRLLRDQEPCITLTLVSYTQKGGREKPARSD